MVHTRMIFGMHLLGKNMKTKKGMTLIEVLIYMGIVVMFLGALYSFTLLILNGRVKSKSQEEVQDNLRLVSKKLEYELKNASAVSINSNVATITSSVTGRGTVLIRNQNSAIRYGVSSIPTCTTASPCALTSNLVEVTSFTISSITSSASNVIVTYRITIRYKDNGNAKLRYQETTTGTIFIRPT